MAAPPGAYGAAAFWDQRYEHETATFDWLQSWDSIKPVLQPHLRAGARILMLGCGNSPMSEQMHAEGFTNITNVDISPHAIRLMKGRAEAKDLTCMYNPPQRSNVLTSTVSHGVCYLRASDQVMDVTKLTFPDASFDLVIDKGPPSDCSFECRYTLVLISPLILRGQRPWTRFFAGAEAFRGQRRCCSRSGLCNPRTLTLGRLVQPEHLRRGL